MTEITKTDIKCATSNHGVAVGLGLLALAEVLEKLVELIEKHIDADQNT